jgi:hypothetical protein
MVLESITAGQPSTLDLWRVARGEGVSRVEINLLKEIFS